MKIILLNLTTAHSWCDGHSTDISACEVWGERAKVQVSRRKFHTHIHLDYARIKFYLVSKKKIIKFSQLNSNSENWIVQNTM